MNNEVANNNWDEPWSLFGAFMESNMNPGVYLVLSWRVI
jgi:hypothetical protein